MKIFARLLLGVLPGVIAAAATPLDSARQAQAMLAPGAWSRVIRVENAASRGPYPAVVDALVFEEGGILWFYTATDGTQSLSLHWNCLAEEKNDLGPLLQAIEPGFVSFHDPPDATGPPDNGPLPNGCFIECLAALRDRARRGEPIEHPRLLSCYAVAPAGLRGHTVLTYETPGGLFLLDPGRSPEPRAMPRQFVDDPMALASAALPGATVARARWVPTELPPQPAQVAGLNSFGSRVPGRQRD